MPWCHTCERFLAPPTVEADGSCPSCHSPVEVAERPLVAEAGQGEDGLEEPGPIPLHLKILGIATAIYLLWRLIQGIVWVVGRF